MEQVVWTIGVVNIVIAICWMFDSYTKDTRHHKERMDIIKIMKAESVSEYAASEGPPKKRINNYFVHGAKEYAKGDGSIE